MMKSNFKKPINPKLLTVMTCATLFLAACGQKDKNEQARVCVDENEWRVDDSHCDNTNENGMRGHSGIGHFLFIPIIGRSPLPQVGQKVVGGSTTPIAGRSVVANGAVSSRGGFGQTAKSGSGSSGSAKSVAS